MADDAPAPAEPAPAPRVEHRIGGRIPWWVAVVVLAAVLGGGIGLLAYLRAP